MHKHLIVVLMAVVSAGPAYGQSDDPHCNVLWEAIAELAFQTEQTRAAVDVNQALGDANVAMQAPARAISRLKFENPGLEERFHSNPALKDIAVEIDPIVA